MNQKKDIKNRADALKRALNEPRATLMKARIAMLLPLEITL